MSRIGMTRKSTIATAAAKKATATGTTPNAVAPMAASRMSTGTMPRLTLPRSSGRSASGSSPKSRRNCGSEASLPCSTTMSPSLQRDRSDLAVEPFVLAADRQQVDVEAVVEKQIFRRPADQA